MLTQFLKSRPTPIRLGVTGIGAIGKGLVLQAGITPGMECVAVCDLNVDRAIAWARHLGRAYSVVQTSDDLDREISRGRLGICEDGMLLATCERIDALLESTNSVLAGGRFAEAALQSRKHVVTMNYEADLMFGSYLVQVARDNGVIYTACDGDQPAVIKRLVDEMQFMGFQLILAGNIKGFLDRYATPESIIAEADKRGLDYKMCASYTDGTKLSIEMAVTANALGLRTLKPGMRGPEAPDVSDVFSHFDFHAIRESGQGVVDYLLGARPQGGVFAVGYTADKYQQNVLNNAFPSAEHMGTGPYYVFYRPYHLCHFEAMLSVAEIFCHRCAVLTPDCGFQTNVYAYAKRDLRTGERLDGIGGFTCYGLIENVTEARGGLPVCLAEGLELRRDRLRDDRISLADVIVPPHREDFAMFARAIECSSRVLAHAAAC